MDVMDIGSGVLVLETFKDPEAMCNRLCKQMFSPASEIMTVGGIKNFLAYIVMVIFI